MNARTQSVISVIVSLAILLQSAVVPALAFAPRQQAGAGAPGRSLAIQPAALTAPLSISRVQSTYQAATAVNNTVVISFTVTNNLLPTRRPNIPATATTTDTVDILASFVLTEDVNTLRNVTLVDTLTGSATFADASAPPVQSGSTFTFTLDDLAPLASATLTMSVLVPAANTLFLDLDTGANVSATLWDGLATAVARPAALAPDALDPATLGRSPEVDPADRDALWQAAALLQDPTALFEYVRDMPYEAYRGSLRGTRGTLWNGSGNSLDQASLLIALLRGAGIPARYRHGTLTTANAQLLISQMFPIAEGVAGSLPAGTPLSDPINDAALIALAQDHWWVEAHLPGGGWTDMDPSFAVASVGDTFFNTVATDGTDRAAAPPAAERHQLNLTLEVERYNAFPVSGGALVTSVPLTASLPIPEVAAKALTVGHFVQTDAAGGLVYTSVNHNYTPYLTIDGPNNLILGDPFSDFLTNFPLASHFTSAEWLTFEIIDPDGNTNSYRRTVKDLIGADARASGGTITLALPSDNAPLVDSNDLYATWLLPNTVPDWTVERDAGNMLPGLVALAQEAQRVDAIVDYANMTPEEEEIAREASFQAQVLASSLMASTGLSFANQADTNLAAIEAGLLVKASYISPRLITTASVFDPITLDSSETVDLRKTDARILPYPGQALDASLTANWVKGVNESALEGEALATITGQPAATTKRLFDAMSAQGIQPVLITLADLSPLGNYTLSPGANGHMLEALNAGKLILAPAERVDLDGSLQVGWWEIDPTTGETVGVMENGLHGALIEYKFFVKYVNAVARAPRLIAKVVEKIWDYVLENLLPALGGTPPLAPLAPMAPVVPVTDTWRYLGGGLCPTGHCGLEQFFGNAIGPSIVPLPDLLFAYISPAVDRTSDRATMAFTANQPPGPPAFALNLTPGTSSINANAQTSFAASIDANFSDTYTVTATAPDGWTVDVAGTGTINARPPFGAPPDDYAILVVAQSGLHTDLVSTAVHTATILATNALSLTVAPEPNISVLMGPAGEEVEVPDAAYRVWLTNTSTVSHTFAINISGPPANSVILNGVAGSTSANVSLPAGSARGVGLYIMPPPGPLPAPGSGYTIDVTVTGVDDPSLMEMDSDSFTMPSLPAGVPALSPSSQIVGPGTAATFGLNLANKGNAAGSFPLTVTLPISTWSVSGLTTPVAVAAGMTDTQSFDVNVTTADVGRTYSFDVATIPVGSGADQIVTGELVVVSAAVLPIGDAGSLLNACVADETVQATLNLLATALSDLDQSCQSGNCDLDARDDAVAAAEALADDFDRLAPNASTAALRTAVADMAGHTTAVDLQADIAAVVGAITPLATEACVWAERAPAVTLTPVRDAILAGGTTTYTVDLTNIGSLATTFEVTATLPSGDILYSRTLGPGATDSTDLPVTESTLGLYPIDVIARASGAGVTTTNAFDSAAGTLNVVDRFLQVTAVTADPPFVETGVSSTTLSVEIANVANIARFVTARTSLLAPNGAVSYTADIPLAIFEGDPRVYTLDTVNTSGYATGFYTATVELLDASLTLIPDGSGYGYLLVGEGLEGAIGVDPMLVAPGTVTVTTAVTTTIRQETILPLAPPAEAAAEWVTFSRPLPDPATLSRDDFVARADGPTDISSGTLANEATPAAVGAVPAQRMDPAETGVTLPANLAPNGVITRTEDVSPAITYNGSWTTVNSAAASSGSYRRSNTTGDTASFTFDGSWVGIGFIASQNSGEAEIFIDGSSQGVVDLYRTIDPHASYYFGGLVTGTHTISVTVLGTANPFAGNDWVYLDFFDHWNGMSLPDGTFEQDDARLILSGSWTNRNDATASGGNHSRNSNDGGAWFPFTGNSLTFQSLAYSGGGQTKLYVDGQYLATVDLYSPTSVTRTYTFDGLGAGPHIFLVEQFRDSASIDTFTTPGVGAPYVPPVQSGIIRIEEDDTALLYNGVPLTQTASSWSTQNSTVASGGHYLRSSTAGDTVALTFNGSWVGVGFTSGNGSGMAEIFIDGISQGTVDNYRLTDLQASYYFAGLGAGSHTITVTVLGTANPLANNARVNIDYFDYWDGSAEAAGTFEAELGDESRIRQSTGWSVRNDATASAGNHLRSSIDSAIWFPFTGDSITFQALAYSGGGDTKLYLDGQYLHTVDLYSSTSQTRSFTFTGLPSGPHVLQVSQYRNQASVDTFTAPGIGAPYVPPADSGVIRVEEDAPQLRYNGVPYTQTATTWTDLAADAGSDRYVARSSNAGDNVAFDFTGTWVGVGFTTGTGSGEAEIFIDGASQGVVDLYRRYDLQASYYFDGLPPGSHTISVTVQGTANPFATNQRVNIDFFDYWDGSNESNGTFEATLDDASRIWRGGGWSARNSTVATDGVHLRHTNKGSIWFPFTGNSVTFEALAFTGGGESKLLLDGQYLATVDLYNAYDITRTFSLTGLAAGPHVLQLTQFRDSASVDSFTTPGSSPFWTPPAPAGVVRHEETAVTLQFSGAPFTATASSWNSIAELEASHGYAARSQTAGDSASLTFFGPWVSLGFVARSNAGQTEIFLDGVSQGIVDTYNAANEPLALFYSGLPTATHTISLTVLGMKNASSTDEWIYLDFFDSWDGTLEADAIFEADPGYQDNDRVDMGRDWSFRTNTTASGGEYYDDGENAWFRFTGDAVSYLAMSDQLAAADVNVYIDGVFIETVDLTYEFSNSPLPVHYTGLGNGAHVLHIANLDRGTVDAFESNPAVPNPGVPLVEWWDASGSGASGVIATAAAGDINNDGVVEIGVSSDNGNFYLYRGDGADTGGGTPIIWQVAVGGEPDAPIFVELDGTPNAEIVVGSESGIWALHDDGTTYWFTDTYKTAFPAGGGAAGDLDGDGIAEVVMIAGNKVVVFANDGSLLFEDTLSGVPAPPILADLTGDGFLDILVLEDSANELHLYDFDQGVSPVITWTYAFTSTLFGHRGAPAVADIDGQQPGGDPGPEIAVTASGFFHVLDADGTHLWTTPIGAGAPGGVSAADIDGDGEIELMTTVQFNGGTIYALNADGTILWDAPALDGTSGTSAATHDFDGDGVWEVFWNGAGQGLTIYRGTDGEIIFNEPLINSITRKDFAVVADVDDDGHGEILAGDPAGFYVVGYDTVWSASREIWSGYNYHVTNINDDFTVPSPEPDSWLIHNTYRTQTPLTNPAPNYEVAITHTVGISGVSIVPGSFSRPATTIGPNSLWSYSQPWFQPTLVTTFDVQLDDMAPGETRQMSQGTAVDYTLPSGKNRILLPPTYATAARLITIAPPTQTVGSGGTAVYTATLTNPTATANRNAPAAAAVYTLRAAGVPAAWLTLPATVTVPDGAAVDVPISVAVPPGTTPSLYTLSVQVDNGSGGSDEAGALLDVVAALTLSLAPPTATAAIDGIAPYTATVTNLESVARTYNLSGSGLATISLPPTVTVAAGGSADVPIIVGAVPGGAWPFTVEAARGNGASASDDAIIIVDGKRRVSVALAPDPAFGGPGTTISYTVTVINLGTLSDTYALTPSVPAGWAWQLLVNGTAVTSLALPPQILNSADLRLLVTPPPGTVAATYPLSVTAQSQINPLVADSALTTAQIGAYGVQVSLDPVNQTLAPSDIGLWQVTVTNTGTVADSFNLTALGLPGLSAQFTPATVALGAGASQVVQLSSDDMDFALPLTYPFAVVATSQGDSRILAEAPGSVTFIEQEGVDVYWRPDYIEQINDFDATFTFVISNTGNVPATFDVAATAPGLLISTTTPIVTLPARSTAIVSVQATATASGTYNIEGTAGNTVLRAVSDSATAQLVILVPTAITLGNAQVAPATPGLAPSWLLLALGATWIIWRRRPRLH